MHSSSYLKMEWFKNQYLIMHRNEKLKILDVGSYNMGGSYKPLFNETEWTYTGMDMVQGSGVDIVVQNCYEWKEIENAVYDVVISGQAFEHMPYFWLVMQEIARVLKPDGICCIIAPSAGPEHRCPVDCYRFYTDGMIALAEYVNMNVLHAFTGEGIRNLNRDVFQDNSGIWHDSMLIAQKGCRYQMLDTTGKKKVAVWGTGTLAAKLWNRVPNLGIHIVAFVDNDKTRQGSFFRGIKVVAPDELWRIDYDIVVICSHYVKEIKEQLMRDLQIDVKRIAVCEDFI